MCGIVGKISLSGGVERPLLERMCAAVEHRGPDSRGLYLADGVGLGVQRLRVIDLRTGDQPIYNEDRSVVVVLNGEIYNYMELRRQLVRAGHTLTTEGDTEVIVHLYEDHGADCVRYLRGMFAFAVWDANRRQLLLARDRLGKKPLIYAHKGGDLWFASEIPALLEEPKIERLVDFDAVDSFLQYQYVPAPLTAFEELKKLPPAHSLIWRDGRITLRHYWRLSYAPLEDAPTPEEAQEEVRHRLLRATELRLRSDVPLGAFLSGGVDSSAVVAAMALQSSAPVKTFSIGFDVAEFDESAFAREVARLYETDHHELVVEPNAMKVLPKLVRHFGEPFADSSAIPTFYVAELARRHVTVALDGTGGDENFGGYGRYIGGRLADRLAAKPRLLQLLARRLCEIVGPGPRAASLRSKLDVETRLALMAAYDRYAWRMAYLKPEDRPLLYTPGFFREVGDANARSVVQTPFAESDAADAVNRLIDVDVQTYLPNALLVKTDITSMAHSLEVRSPLLDHELMEFVARLPGAWKVGGGMTKRIFKEALRPWLPGTILDRPKWGFGSPIAEWLRGSLRELPREVLLDRASVNRGWFREESLRSMIDDHVSGRRDNATKLWALIQLELWLRTFIDDRVRQPAVELA
jgi:asparagine synthase (glutamine-hydrolysing)